MNPLPPNADELVSAYLDGEAAPDEVAIVESSPELLSRVEALRLLASPLGEPVVPPSGQKEAHIAAALDAFDLLFQGADGADLDDRPALASVMAPAESAEPAAAATPATPPPSTVTSLERERARRRPRRFNTGVIAAAAAVLLLFVAAAALSFGRGNSSEDVATSAADAVAEVTAADEDGEAMDDDDAMEDSFEQGTSALRALDEPAQAAGAAPQPTVVPPAAAEMAEDAMSDEEAVAADSDMDDSAMDTESADQEESFAEPEADGASDDAAALSFFLGDFDSRADLKADVEDNGLGLSIEDLLAIASEFEVDNTPACLAEVPELADTDPAQVLAEAFLEDEGDIVAEIYVVTTPEAGRDVYLVDREDCSVLAILDDQ